MRLKKDTLRVCNEPLGVVYHGKVDLMCKRCPSHPVIRVEIVQGNAT